MTNAPTFATPSQAHAWSLLPEHARMDVLHRYDRDKRDAGVAVLLGVLFHAPWIYTGRIGAQFAAWFLIGWAILLTAGIGLVVTVPMAALLGVRLVRRHNEELADRLLTQARAMTAGGVA